MALPTTEACVAAEERLVGRAFPSSLRQRLIRENGGELTCDGEIWQLHPVWDPGDRRRAQSSASHIARETEAARRWRGFPGQGVAIGENIQGDRLILLPGGEEIYRWDHETATCDLVAVSW